MKKSACYFNGKITTTDKIGISPYDIGFLRGYGVFDVMCTQNGKAFLLDEHWKRFAASAKELNLKVPVKKDAYKKIVGKLLKKNGFSKSTIRTVLTGGQSHNGFSHASGSETFLILIEPFKALPSEIFRHGASVMTLSYKRDYPRAKITNYVTAIKNQQLKEKSRHLEMIYLQGGQALEASTSNFFIVKNGRLITQKDGILLGITRNLAIRLAKKRGLPVKERSISEKELLTADEIFLTATNKDIVPVVKIDGQRVGDGQVGKNTKVMMQLFQDFAKKY